MSTEQPTLFDIGSVHMREFSPVPAAMAGARQFTHGGHNAAGLENTMADPIRAYRTQLAYRQAQSQGEAPGIRRSYAALRDQTDRQYDFMTRPQEEGGMGLRHEVVDEDPYKSGEDMAADVSKGRIRTLSTAATGEHAFLTNDENDRFRAVHDVFGHAAIGRGFSRHGEEAAYRSHRQMFSRSAQDALASETRGQNAMLNYGPGGFVDQTKLVGLPKFAKQV